MTRVSLTPPRSVIAGAVLAILGGGAHAAAGSSAQLPQFNQLDRNASGFIEPPEAQQAMAEQQFRGADSNSDARLSQSEYRSLRQGQGGMAQAPQQGQPPQAGQQAQAQQQPQAGGGQSGAEIVVQEQQPQIQVEQKPPQVTVQKQPPDITVVQPDPQVTIQQQKPDVTVREARPQVDVQSQGQPQVAIKEGGEPDVRYRESDQAAAQQQQPDQQQATAQGIEGKTIGDLSGMSVVTMNGDDIGEVEQIVQSTADNKLHAVVAGGGFLGIGEDRAAIPLDEMSLQEDQLVWQTASSGDALEQRRYDEQNYTEVQQEDVTVAELSGQAGAGGGQQQLSFQQLDRDGDGTISQDEAAQSPQLQQQWSQADADNNDQIDQSEFSAFEQQSAQPPAQPGAGTAAPADTGN